MDVLVNGVYAVCVSSICGLNMVLFYSFTSFLLLLAQKLKKGHWDL